MTVQGKVETYMLSGSLWDKILLFVLPMACSSILQQLFNAADIIVVGRFAGSSSLAAVGANGPIINLIVGMFTGLSVGASAVIATFIGQKKEEGIHKAVHTAILVSIICGAVITVVGVIFARYVLILMKTPDNILKLAVVYLRIYSLGMPFILLYNFSAAILRAGGDTKRPLMALMASGVVNVILNLFFVVVCHMTVEGVAIATLVSNIISVSLTLGFLIKEKGVLQLQIKKLRIHKNVLIKIARIGIPAGLQGAVFSISNVCIQSALNGLGSAAVAATAAAVNYEYIAYYVLSSFGQAGVTFIGQNYGAGQWKRCIKIVKQCILLGGIAAVVLSVIFLCFSRELIEIFTSDPAVIELGIVRMRMILSFEIVNMVIEVLSGSMRGFSHSTEPALVCMAGVCGVRICWLYTVFAHYSTYTTLLLVYPVSWSVTAIVLAVTCFLLKKHTNIPFA